MKRILSGIKPTGKPHIGNYFGMMRPAIEWQDKGEAYYFIADYHALTTVTDPAKAVLFRQSDVPAHTELAWLLTCQTPMAMLENAHAYKDHLAKSKQVSHGLFAYPVLMAADILIYDSDIVPVGKDQKQHVEITRDLAVKMNTLYGSIFKIPEPSILPTVATIPGLDGQKMSKSYDNTIELFLDEKPLRKKIMGIITDSTPVEAPKDPTTSSIVALYRFFAPEADVAKMEADFRSGGFGYGDFKKRLFEAVWEYFSAMRKRRAELAADPGYVDGVLKAGAEKASSTANQVMERVRRAVGLRD